MANELILENPLSSDRKPVKVGDDSTGLLLADNEVYIENDANVGGDLTVNGSITTETGSNTLDGITSIRTAQTHEAGMHLNPAGKIEIGEPAVGSGSIAALGYGLTNQSILVLYSRQDHGDYFTISTTTSGATSIFTVDDDATAAHLTLDVDGSIILDPADGKYIFKNNGTEFSAANSAYAGMILGYTDIGLDESAATYNLTTGYVVPTSEFKVTFKIPPSGNVEIEMQIGWDAGSSNVGDCFAGLSDNASYNAVDDFHEVELFDAMSRGALRVIRHSWTLTGLSSVGDEEEIWVGFKSSSTGGTPHLEWGGDAANLTSDFIMKAIALPATIAT